MGETTNTNGLYVKLDDVLAVLQSRADCFTDWAKNGTFINDADRKEHARRAELLEGIASLIATELRKVDVEAIVDEVIEERYKHHEERRHSASVRALKHYDQCGENDEVVESLLEAAHRRKATMNELLRVQSRLLDRLA